MSSTSADRPRPVTITTRYGGSVRTPLDWRICKPHTLVLHAPTRAMFQIHARPDKSLNEPLTLEHFGARILSVFGGGPWPMGAALAVLQREAVLMILYHLGLTAIAGGTRADHHPPDDGLPF
jgi:hypothetical protein